MLCKIGDVEIWRLLEILAPFKTPEELFPTAGPDVSKILAALIPGSLCARTGRVILPIQSFLLKTPKHVILVDAFVGNDKTVPTLPEWHKRSDHRYMAALMAAGVGVSDIDYVLCTHLHTDHVGWNTRLQNGRWVPTFPNARYLMPKADCAMQHALNSTIYQESVSPVVAAQQAELVEAGHRLGDQVTLVPTPGHTPGHVSVQIQSGGHEALITGDALHSSAQCQHPNWHFRYDADADVAVTSRIRLLEMACESGCAVLGSHFTLPSLGRVRMAKGRFHWHDCDGGYAPVSQA